MLISPKLTQHKLLICVQQHLTKKMLNSRTLKTMSFICFEDFHPSFFFLAHVFEFIFASYVAKYIVPCLVKVTKEKQHMFHVKNVNFQIGHFFS